MDDYINQKMNYLTKRQIKRITNRVLDCDKYEMINMDKVIYIFSDSDNPGPGEERKYTCREVFTPNAESFLRISTYIEIESHNKIVQNYRDKIKEILFDEFPFGIRGLVESYMWC